MITNYDADRETIINSVESLLPALDELFLTHYYETMTPSTHEAIINFGFKTEDEIKKINMVRLLNGTAFNHMKNGGKPL